MAKIHKSAQVNLDNAKPVIISRPEYGQPLREYLLNSDQLPEHKNDPAAETTKNRTADHAASPNSGAPAALFAQAEQRAEQLVHEARETAKQILDETQQQLPELRGKAYEAGYAEGYKAGEKSFDASKSELQISFKNMTDQLENRIDQMIDCMEDELLDLAVDIAERIIGIELARKSKTYHAFLRQALDNLKKQEKAVVYLNEKEYQQFIVAEPFVMPENQGQIRFIGDPKLAPGSCLIETGYSRFDASAATQLDQIRKKAKAEDRHETH
ncbi:MAG: FliH/SctL family protein [Clostridiaceae bacterium]|nr:FliH/SctL family protein [Clostridiaceae bacterium]